MNKLIVTAMMMLILCTTAIASNGVLSLSNDDYITIKAAESLNTQSFTIETWLYSNNNKAKFIFSRTTYEDANGVLIGFAGGSLQGRIRFWLNGQVFTSNTMIPLQVWTHIALTVDRGLAILYINGEKDIEAKIGTYLNYTSDIYIGADQDCPNGCLNDSTNQFFDGKLDEFRIWNRALSQSEVAYYMNNVPEYSSYLVTRLTFDNDIRDVSYYDNDTINYGAKIIPLDWNKPIATLRLVVTGYTPIWEGTCTIRNVQQNRSLSCTINSGCYQAVFYDNTYVAREGDTIEVTVRGSGISCTGKASRVLTATNISSQSVGIDVSSCDSEEEYRHLVYTLSRGLNCISVPFIIDNLTFANLNTMMSNNMNVAFSLNGKWNCYLPSFSTSTNNVTLRCGEGYLVDVRQDVTFTLRGKPCGQLGAPIKSFLNNDFRVFAGTTDADTITVKRLSTAEVVSSAIEDGKYTAIFVDTVFSEKERFSITLIKDGQYYSEDYNIGSGIVQMRNIVFTVPSEDCLLQNFPNPFNPDTWIPYKLSSTKDVIINIYDIQGNNIRTLDLGKQSAGEYIVRGKAAYWDGRDVSGQTVSSGIYFYNMEGITRKMIILK